MTTSSLPHGGDVSARVAAEIRAELGRQRISLRAFAVRSGLSKQWVARRLSTGETPLSLDDVQLIADLLHVPVLQFLRPWLSAPPVGLEPTTARVTGLVRHLYAVA